MTQIREAYEYLNDNENRAAYDALYFDLQDQWTRYRQRQESQRKEQERKRADEEQYAARERAEQERKAVEAERVKRMKEEQRVAKEKAERERMKEERAKQAEERSKQAAQRARVRQEQAAQERLRRQKEMGAEKRSEEAARKLRIDQERAAQERLKSIMIEEQLEAIRRNWTEMREAVEHRKCEPVSSLSSGCAHPRFGWPRKKGKADCVFCKQFCTKLFFYCPECNASACPGCKYNYCVY